ncbi:DNA primase [Thalassobaculum sp. OXR-137]|uniref:DNA primase n=1 Tax=Thalassobaculum sp. OXR-137 TaxID=3100173 RepID=UPI002AC89E52|nr:DNA primase [Thalassobaculum sp. OXR-137]WPZ35717.1 DNA primase [Thalassobaculum sp. OXR-137]
MSLPPHFLDELRDRVTVSSVIGRKYKLERKGREFLAVCPFHNDTKPSLSIVDDKGFYHCFACGAHGDVFKFLMENDGLKFMEAVEQVASLAGLEVPKESPEEQQRAERRRSLQEVVDLACRWYERQLHTSAGEAGLRYLKERGLSDDTIKTFRLGWAPDDRKALQRAMKAEGVETDVLVEAGLVKRYEEGERSGETVDYMRGRVLFPITDRRGKVIAFGGRVLGDGQPKYLNSPDTPLFHKGRILYGLAQAREPAHKSGELMVAEGYMDVIALAQAGFPAVAPLGTALTEDQIVELWRITPEPILCFDGDTAGQRAARRACDRALPLLKPGHSLRFVTLPEGQDPDDLIQRDGKKALRAILNTAIGLADFLWASELLATPTDTPERKAAFFKRMRDLVREVADQGVQIAYKDHMEARIDEMRRPQGRAGSGYGGRDFGRNQERGGAARGRGNDRQRGGRWTPPTPPEPAGSRTARALVDAVLPRRQQQVILATFLHHPGLLDELGEVLATLALDDPFLDNLRRQILEINAEDTGLDADGLRDHLMALGYSETVDGLLSDEALHHAGFARKGASHSDARQGLAELLGRFAGPLLREQLFDAQREYEQTFSEASWQRMLSLQSTLQAITSASALEDAN